MIRRNKWYKELWWWILERFTIPKDWERPCIKHSIAFKRACPESKHIETEECRKCGWLVKVENV